MGNGEDPFRANFQRANEHFQNSATQEHNYVRINNQPIADGRERVTEGEQVSTIGAELCI
jgi:hypothetical protein